MSEPPAHLKLLSSTETPKEQCPVTWNRMVVHPCQSPQTAEGFSGEEDYNALQN